MANTLTNLIPDIYAALDVVSRELVGFIPSVQRDAAADRVALNQSLRIPAAPANAAGGDFTPAMSIPSASNQTIANSALTISKSRFYPFSWTGEEIKSVDSGPGFLTIKQGQIAQAMRGLVNEMESDLATAIYQGASRGYGSAATTPFGTAGDFSDAAQVRKILDDNGAPMSDRSLVVNTAAGANIRAKQGVATVQTDPSILRQGILLDINGFAIRESAQVKTHTASTNTTAVLTGVVNAVGATSLALKGSGGSGSFTTGDIIVHARDTGNKYVLASGDADISGGGTLVINAPGLQLAMTSADSAITTTATYTANCAFSRNAVLFATRIPAMPAQGDLATDSITVTDPVSGISFEIRYYPGMGMGVFYVMACWGVKVIKPEHVAILIG